MNDNNDPVYVIGHRNPDTDAICAAIAYADYLQHKKMPHAVAACCGPANSRTQYVLDLAKVAHPQILSNVKPKVTHVGTTKPVYAKEEEPFLDVYSRMHKYGFRTMLIVDDNMHVTGIAPMLDLMQVLLPATGDRSEQRIVNTSLKRVRQVIEGNFLNEIDGDKNERLYMSVAAMSSDLFGMHIKNFPSAESIVVAGNRPSVQKRAIDYGVRLLVVTGGTNISPELLSAAKEKKVSVLSSPYDTAMTTILIKGANIIESAIDKDFISFEEHVLLENAIKQARTTEQTLFPVVDEHKKLVGVFTKTDLAYPKRVKLILVDHNELAQAVVGADQAEILEVLDHHRVGGGLVTAEPIRFINDTVGSTCTMITYLFREAEITPKKGIALCLAAGIVSDTLNLTSPTTTDTDREMIKWLENYTERDTDDYSKELFSAGSALATYSPDEVVDLDCKIYEESGWNFSAAQVEELGMRRFWEQRDELKEALDKFRVERGLDFSCLLVTDITKHYSLLLTSCEQRMLKAIEFPEKEDDLYELTGVVSRKKQLLPSLLQGLNKVLK